MPIVNLAQVRRQLALKGLTPASVVPESSGGRTEEACFRPARVVEGVRLEARPVGPAEHWPGTLAFLDGVQHAELLAYAGAAPIVAAEVAAAVRERRGRELVTVVEARRRLVLGRPAALAAGGESLQLFDAVPVPLDQAAHPVRDLAAIARALDQVRGALELNVGERFRERSSGWLLVDGALTESPRWASDARMIAVAKSHATLPFEGDELDRFLRLPHGHRTSVYEPAARNLAPVREWALRLWPWEHKDIFHGLVRVQVAPQNADAHAADALSRRLLAERAPLSTPDRRWDRLLYGIHSVEVYLHAGAHALR